MIKNLFWKLIYPYKAEFWVEGPAEQNIHIMREFIMTASLPIFEEKGNEIIFLLPVNKIAMGWGWTAATCTFKRWSENCCKIILHFKKIRNGAWAFLILFFPWIIIDAWDKGDASKLWFIPALFLFVNTLAGLGSVLINYLHIIRFFKNKLFLN